MLEAFLKLENTKGSLPIADALLEGASIDITILEEGVRKHSQLDREKTSEFYALIHTLLREENLTPFHIMTDTRITSLVRTIGDARSMVGYCEKQLVECRALLESRKKEVVSLREEVRQAQVNLMARLTVN